MAFIIEIINPFPESSVKELLENHLLIPRKIRHFLRIKKQILINGQAVTWQSPVKTGDTIKLIVDEEMYPEKDILWGNPKAIEVVYEDQHLIIVNKVEGMKTHANQPDEIALLNHVSAYCRKTCYVVHRLDQETSGLILFAKNPFILPLLNRQLENRNISRHYWALIAGRLPHKKESYRESIGRHRHDRRKRIVDKKAGQPAITHVTRLKLLENASLINCQLDTGRTHQIRVHLSYHKYPILGDPLYQDTKSPHRLMLHAQKLTFTHPLTLEKISLHVKSSSFENILNQYR